MKFHQIRNATCVIESGPYKILMDPMLSDPGVLPPFAWIRHKARKNPLVSLPENTFDQLATVTHCLLTHSQKLGIRGLQHTDHLDVAGEVFLREKNIPILTGAPDTAYLKKLNLNVMAGLVWWEKKSVFDWEITAIPAQHGHGWIHHLMANGAGYFLQLPQEPSIYLCGDTVLTNHVKRCLTELKPDVVVMASGSASLDIGGPILMPMSELIECVDLAPGIVVANHLEALNHCPTSRQHLRDALMEAGLISKVYIPDDGETLSL